MLGFGATTAAQEVEVHIAEAEICMRYLTVWRFLAEGRGELSQKGLSAANVSFC